MKRWRRISRLMRALSPIRVMVDWSYDGYQYYDEHDGPKHTWKSRVAFWVLWKWQVLSAIFRCLFARGDDDLRAQPLWARPLYRAKAIICLLFGLHYRNDAEPWGHYSHEFC